VPQPEAAHTLRGLAYAVRVDEQLARLDVQLCFDGAAPPRLVYGARKAAAFLREPRVASPPSAARALEVRDGLIALPQLAPDSCIEYAIDVRAALAYDSLLLAYPGERAVMIGAELFLWRPPKRSAELRSELRFVLPEGVRVSTPWPQPPQRAGGYVLDERAFAYTGHLVLGQFEERAIAVPGGQLRATFMPGFAPAVVDALATWLERSGRAVAWPGAAFPVPEAQVILAPSSPSPSAIHFGHTGRSGGASIVLFVPTNVDASQLREDWIAIHEFSHLWHPFIRREDAWLSEGLATYLQEVLRVRAGLLPAELAWQRLYEGAALGRQTTRSLTEETRRMAFEPNYRTVYWAGAAIALLIDVELRRQSQGRTSLPVLLARLRAEPALFTRGSSARELLRALDELAGLRACESLALRYLEAELPDLTAAYAQLGITLAQGEARFQSAPLAWVREAIMQQAVAH